MHAALLPFFPTPIDDIIAVTHVPIFCPRIIGIAQANVTVPVIHRACNIPTDADEL